MATIQHVFAALPIPPNDMFGINHNIACDTVRKDPIQKSLYSKKRKLPSFRGIGSIKDHGIGHPGKLPRSKA
jgi:hypothetical protein